MEPSINPSASRSTHTLSILGNGKLPRTPVKLHHCQPPISIAMPLQPLRGATLPAYHPHHVITLYPPQLLKSSPPTDSPAGRLRCRPDRTPLQTRLQTLPIPHSHRSHHPHQPHHPAGVASIHHALSSRSRPPQETAETYTRTHQLPRTTVIPLHINPRISPIPVPLPPVKTANRSCHPPRFHSLSTRSPAFSPSQNRARKRPQQIMISPWWCPGKVSLSNSSFSSAGVLALMASFIPSSYFPYSKCKQPVWIFQEGIAKSCPGTLYWKKTTKTEGKPWHIPTIGKTL